MKNMFRILVYPEFGVFSGISYLYTAKKLHYDRRDFKTQQKIR